MLEKSTTIDLRGMCATSDEFEDWTNSYVLQNWATFAMFEAWETSTVLEEWATSADLEPWAIYHIVGKIRELRQKQRAVIEFLEMEGCSEIHQRLKIVYTEVTIDISNVRRWMKRSTNSNQHWKQRQVYDPETKAQSGTALDWHHSSSPKKKKFKVQRSSKKVMATVFWDRRGVILIDFLDEGKLFKKKRLEISLKSVKLHHYNARPHTSYQTSKAIGQMSWSLVPQPPLQPRFGTLFEDLQEVKRSIKTWLGKLPPAYFQSGFTGQCWRKCIATAGEYSGTSTYERPNIRVFRDTSRRASDHLLLVTSEIRDTSSSVEDINLWQHGITGEMWWRDMPFQSIRSSVEFEQCEGRYMPPLEVCFQLLQHSAMERSLEQRYTIKFCVRLGKNATETFQMLQKAFKDDCISRSQYGKWHKAFKEGREEVADEPRSGRPTTARTDENVDRVLEVLRTDRRLSIQKIADTLHMSTLWYMG
ncbi:hypothetical protein LAZ67_2002195 [Cordylochernes scorpioides]|uniref:Mos1 transposase HTH domain-containing protein n=1 Tax=Cordylochernes scorpioides TaxID=51811 RepID=A0ABY6K207_9ARAC|nr:hypothetical protein LAZ67_2002195 [Cordylochernes scorpioides]